MLPRTDRGKRSQLLTAESVVSSRSSPEIITPGSLHEGNTTTDEPTVVGPSRDTVEAGNYPENAQNLQQTLSSYKQLATRYRAERDDQARKALAQEETAALAKDDAARLTETVEELRSELRELRVAHLGQLGTDRTHREQTVETSLTTTSMAASWRPRGIDPSKKLKGQSPDEYGPWRYSIDEKLETDAPLYQTERSKVRYALSQMEQPIFYTMQDYVNENRALSFGDLMDEVEHYLGFHLQQRDAKKELQTTVQKPSEGITQYYHRIRSLWQKAKTPEEDRIDQFLTSMLPALSNSLLARRYTSAREVLDDARTVEDRRKDVRHNHPHLGRARHLITTGPASTFVPPRTGDTVRASTRPEATPATDLRRNPMSGPVAKKPEKWHGPWYEPEKYPKRLDDAEKARLIREGRCWGCRGSGHRSADPCCPKNVTEARKMHAIASSEVMDGPSSDEEEGKELSPI